MCGLIAVILYILFILFLSSIFFPLPVNDSGLTRYRTVPWATMSIIIINTVIFVLWTAPDLYQVVDGEETFEPSVDYFAKIYIYGYNEQPIVEGKGVGAFTTFSSVFMHADFWHVFFNMLYLWTFGRRVEDACGSWRFLLFYLLAGMIAGMGSVLLRPGVDMVPGIGASGAISGVMGAYLFLFPGARVECMWGIGLMLRIPYAAIKSATKAKNEEYKFWRWTVTMPAILLLIWFVFQQLAPSVESIQSDDQLGGVNYLAHLAGFLSALTVFFFVRKDVMVRYLQGRSL